METINYQIIIISFVVLIAAIAAGILWAAFRYGKQWRIVHNEEKENQELIKLMEEEREQKNRIIHLIKTKKYTPLN